MIEFAGYAAAVLAGLTLGLIGGGGSILTVPILVYLMGKDPVVSTAYSLFVVGITSLVGAIQKMTQGLVSYKTALVFAVPSFIAVFLTRRYLVPAIPEELFSIGDFMVTKEIGIMLFFALIMLVAAISMFRGRKEKEGEEEPIQFNYLMISLEGAGVGVLTGVVGAGGGFLIIPALVLFAKLPMKMAVGTSLLIIAAKSLIGFLGDIQADVAIEWEFLLLFSALSVIGIFIGNYLSKLISGQGLKKIFAVFVVAMALLIVIKELAFPA